MILLALFIVAALASGLDAVAGGGGLVTLPALLVAGLDPVTALATNKVQSSAGATSATLLFARRGLLGWPAGAAFVAAGAAGAAAGAACAAHVPRAALQAGVPLVLIAVAVYFLCAERPTTERGPRLRADAFALLVVAPIGFYDGLFGPGTGAFLAVGFVALLGYGITVATAHAKLANAASNWGALIVFALTGHVDWQVGLVMAAGAALGGQVGSRLAIRHGARLIRPILVAMSCAMAVKLLADPANPLRQAIGAVLR